MKNIFKIYTSDMKRLIRNPFALIIAIGLCALPSLYAWFNIYSNWDPYANTSNLKIAVATQDVGYTQEDGTTVNMGNEVIEELKTNKKIGWVFTNSSDEAMNGVYSGKYYAAVVIGSDFSSTMYNVLKQDFKNPTITYYENEKKNAVATKITDSAVSTLKQSINEKFVEVIASSIFKQTNSLSDEIKSTGSLDELIKKLDQINQNVKSYNTMVDSLIASDKQLSSSVSGANAQIPGLQKKVQKAQGSISDANSSLTKSKTTLSDYSTQVQTTLSSIESSIDAVSTDLTNAGLADKAKTIADNITKTTTDTAALETQLNTLRNTLSTLLQNQDATASPDTTKQIQQAISTIDSLKSSADNIMTSINSIQQQSGQSGQNLLNQSSTSQVSSEQAASEAQQAASEAASEAAIQSQTIQNAVNSNIGSVTNTLSSCKDSIENIKNMYKNNLAPEMDNVLNSMSQILTNVTNLLGDLNKTLGDMTSVFDGVNTTVSGADESLQKIKTVLTTVSDRLSVVTEKVNSAKSDDKTQTFIKVLGGDPQAYGEFFAEPVQVNTKSVYPIANYGSAVAPFYTVLALWVGALILVSIVRVKAEPENLKNLKSYQLFFGRYLLFFTLGQLQTLIVVLGDIFLLHCQVLYPGLFWFAAAITSFVFSLLIFALTISFGDIGKALAVIMVVIQIAGSGGTYPIEILPVFYQNIYIFFPFPYAINAIRETVGGMYGSTYETCIVELLIFAVAALLIGLVIRIPFVGFNHFMEKRMEDTKMM